MKRRILPRSLIVILAFTAGNIASGRLAWAYQTGHHSETLYDPVRSREIPCELYYPAETAGDDVPVSTGQFPVVAFGHGFIIPWSQYEYVWDELTAGGYMVIFPLTEGSLFPAPDHLEFGLDLSFCITRLRELGADSSSFLFGHVAGESAVMGHSMGGGSSFLAAAQNSTISAILNLAAAETDPSAIEAAGSVTQPALIISGSLDCVTPPQTHQLPMYQALSSDCRTYVSLTGASHCQFANSYFICTLGESSCDDPEISLEIQEQRTMQYVMTWLNAVVQHQAEEWQDFENMLQSSASTGTITYQEDCEEPPVPTTTPAPTFPPPPSRTPTPENTPFPTSSPSPAASATQTPAATPTSNPTIPPTVTHSPVATQTPTPQLSPSPTPSGTMPPSPEPTSTPDPCGDYAGVRLQVPGNFFTEGTEFYLRALLCNPDPTPWNEIRLFVVLEITGTYFFWPEWTQTTGSFEIASLPAGGTEVEIIPSFYWPGGTGSGTDTGLIGALTDAAVTAIIGDYDSVVFGWNS